MWNKKSSIGYKNVFLQQIRDVEQQIYRQLGDGHDAIVHYAFGKDKVFILNYSAFKKSTRIIYKTNCKREN